MCRVGRQVEASLAEVELKPARAPASILFPASHGYGLAFTLLLQVFTNPVICININNGRFHVPIGAVMRIRIRDTVLFKPRDPMLF